MVLACSAWALPSRCKTGSMRDYKDHSSRNPAPEPAATPMRQPERTRPQIPAEEESEPVPPERRRGHGWIWLILIALLLLSGAVWWWIASLPMASGQLGLLPQAASSAATQSVVPRVTVKKAESAVVTPVVAPSVSATALLTSAVAASSSTASTQSVQFNFYHILPQMKVDIPADILGSGPGIPSAETSSVAVGEPVRIQVGALNNFAGAQVIQERLALLGIPSHLEKLQSGAHAQYYLVFTRCYASSSDAQPALAKIRGMGITPVLQPVVAPGLSAPLASPAP